MRSFDGIRSQRGRRERDTAEGLGRKAWTKSRREVVAQFSTGSGMRVGSDQARDVWHREVVAVLQMLDLCTLKCWMNRTGRIQVPGRPSRAVPGLANVSLAWAAESRICGLNRQIPVLQLREYRALTAAR